MAAKGWTIWIRAPGFSCLGLQQWWTKGHYKTHKAALISKETKGTFEYLLLPKGVKPTGSEEERSDAS